MSFAVDGDILLYASDVEFHVAGKNHPVLFEVHLKNRFSRPTCLPDAFTHLRDDDLHISLDIQPYLMIWFTI